MEIMQVDGRLPRTILAAMITDPNFLAEVSGYWPPEGLFQHKYQNLIAGWCVSYFTKHSAAPQHVIQTAYDAWVERNPGSEESPFIARMLAYMAAEYKPIPTSYAIEQAGRYFNTNLARVKVDEASTLLAANRPDDAWAIIEGMRQISTGTNAYTNLGDEDAFLDAYDYAQGPNLIQWEGDVFDSLNLFFAEQLGRGCFVSLMAGEKVGKSWWLMELAWQAARCGQRVAFFSVGDMNAKQIRRRLISRICRRPIKARDVLLPTFIEPGGVMDEDSVNFRKVTFDTELAREEFRVTLGQWHQTAIGSNIRLFDAPMASMTAEGVRHRATRLLHSDWPPDVIVIDYADILAPINGGDDSRHQSNRTWQELRRISQELDCLVVTATQADAASYSVHTLGRANFSEDKRKFAHVTGMVGINQIEIEKEMQVTRLNWILGRELEVTKQVHVAGCLPLGRIALQATF